ncbi:FAD binding domain-containing protein [Candidatus Entotheonella palauensis]|uniref:FAD binding domain-containing protein n=1 Tax=Candidatus Entotheonella palauensis TaxID=93172 RepID=UPI000B7CB39F|nr:xanthine dehydrogenase family protein subunit M [Candidatus Entotheonella palauensis]
MGRYEQPDSLEQSLEILARSPMTIVAGATDIYPQQTTPKVWGGYESTGWLDISKIDGLRDIVERDDHYHIGCLTTWTDIQRADLPPYFDGLKCAAQDVGSLQIQNRGTVVGNLCNASPAADGVPPLLTLNAMVDICSHRGQRQLPLSQFILGNRRTALEPDEMVVAIQVPKLSSRCRSAFSKLGARRYLVISIAMAAAVIDLEPDRTIGDCRIAIGACSAVAMRLTVLEQALMGQAIHTVSPDMFGPDLFTELAPIDDVCASASYRRRAAQVLTSRLLTELQGEEGV